MKTTAEYLQSLADTKSSIKQALINKGKQPTLVFSSYAQLILNIEEGSTIDLSFITAGAGQILSGYVGSDKDGNPVNGTITTKTSNDVEFIGGTVEFPPGYYAGVSKSIPTGNVTTNLNVVTVSGGWVSDKTFEVGTAVEGREVTPTTYDMVYPAYSFLTSGLTIKGDENLKAENIASGVSIFGISGTHSGGYDTSDATVSTTDIVMGVTAYGPNGKIYGLRRLAEDITVYFMNGKLCTESPVYLDPGNSVTITTFDGTATPLDIVSGKTAYVTGGMVTGGMGHLTVGNMVIQENAMLSVPSKSYVLFLSFDLKQIAGIGDLLAANIVKGKTIAGIEGSHLCLAGEEVTAGVLVDDGGVLKVQKLAFNGTAPSDDGDPISVDTFYTFNTGRDEPVYDSGSSGGSTMEIYKCAEVIEATSGDGYIISGCGYIPANGTYTPTEVAGVSQIKYKNESNCCLWFDSTSGWSIMLYESGEYYTKWEDTGSVSESLLDVESWYDVGGEGGYPEIAAIEGTPASWSGYKYDFDSSSFSKTLTEGLEYKMAAPIVGKCYNADATMLIDLYAPSGLVFYAPLHEEKTTDELGNTLNYNGTQTFVTENGVPCMYCNSTYVYSNSSNIPSSNATRTLSCMVKLHTINNNDVAWILYTGKDSYYMRFVSGRGKSDLVCELSNGNWLGGGSFTSDISSWAHVSAVYDNRVMTMYLNGVYITSFSITSDLNTESTIGIGTVQGNTYRYFNGYISEVKVWNRVLSADEIKAEADRCIAMVDNSGSGSAYGIKFTIDGGDNIPPQFNGTYTQSDVTATGTSRVWTKDDDPIYNVKYHQTEGSWFLYEDDYDFEPLASGENPWEDIVRAGVTVTVTE